MQHVPPWVMSVIIVAQPGMSPMPYDPATQIVTLESDLSPVPLPGVKWRIKAPVNSSGSPAGKPFTFLWDSRDVPDAARVQVRVLPRDNDPGVPTTATGFRSYYTRKLL